MTETSTAPAAAPGRPASALARAVVVALVALVALVGLPATASAAASSGERELLQLINRDRSAHGLAPLQLSTVISDQVSRPWSSRMSSTGTLAHSGTGQQIFDAIARHYPSTRSVGENVGYGASVEALHTALMNSSGHRANILGAAFRYVGLGLVPSGNRLWLTQSFFATTDAVAVEPSASPGEVEDTRKWVTALYVDFLGRQPETSGRDFWASQVLEGRMSRQQVAYSMATTEEWLNKLVTEMYQRTLGRPADQPGLVFWRDQLRGGMPVAEVAARFYSSQEYYERLGSRTDLWVRDLYRALLGREAEASGVDFWVQRAQSRGRLTVALEFYGSHENNIRRVERLYSTLLGRSADGAGLRTWPAVVGAQGDLSLASYLAASHEYWLRAGSR